MTILDRLQQARDSLKDAESRLEELRLNSERLVDNADKSLTIARNELDEIAQSLGFVAPASASRDPLL